MVMTIGFPCSFQNTIQSPLQDFKFCLLPWGVHSSSKQAPPPPGLGATVTVVLILWHCQPASFSHQAVIPTSIHPNPTYPSKAVVLKPNYASEITWGTLETYRCPRGLCWGPGNLFFKHSLADCDIQPKGSPILMTPGSRHFCLPMNTKHHSAI